MNPIFEQAKASLTALDSQGQLSLFYSYAKPLGNPTLDTDEWATFPPLPYATTIAMFTDDIREKAPIHGLRLSYADAAVYHKFVVIVDRIVCQMPPKKIKTLLRPLENIPAAMGNSQLWFLMMLASGWQGVAGLSYRKVPPGVSQFDTVVLPGRTPSKKKESRTNCAKIMAREKVACPEGSFRTIIPNLIADSIIFLDKLQDGRVTNHSPKRYGTLADKQIFEAWESGSYRTYAELASDRCQPVEEIRKAIDRHKKRR